MIRFLIKGLLRDKNRSLLPIIVVAIGVMLTVFLQAYITGVFGDSIDFSAKFSTGHVKIMTRAYADNSAQKPNDLAIMNSGEIMNELSTEYPDMKWVERISFGGLIDVPDENGETKAQGPAAGLAIDMFSEGTEELDRMRISESLVRGKLPTENGEILISEEFSQKLQVNPGDEVTLISSTMFGSMAIYNFKLAGTVAFGTRILDRGAIIVDIEDARISLDMFDATSEILGYLGVGYYDVELADTLVKEYNQKYSDPEDEFSPIMLSMKEQGGFGTMIEYAEIVSVFMVMIFVIAMSVVLWISGLVSGLRRYGEVGVRLALGEGKGHIFRSMLTESLAIGIVGSFLGTLIGLLFAYWLQVKGINVGDMMEASTIMMPSTFHARINTETFYIGFMPGIFSTFLGTSLSGFGIYKRKTAQLFKEFES